jgi:hypothetical protein
MFILGSNATFNGRSPFVFGNKLISVGYLNSYDYTVTPDRHFCLRVTDKTTLDETYYTAEIDIGANNYTLTEKPYGFVIGDRIVVAQKTEYYPNNGVALFSIDSSFTIQDQKIIETNMLFSELRESIFKDKDSFVVMRSDTNFRLTSFNKNLTQVWNIDLDVAYNTTFSRSKFVKSSTGDFFIATNPKTIIKLNSSGVRVSEFNLSDSLTTGQFTISIDSSNRICFTSNSDIVILDTSLTIQSSFVCSGLSDPPTSSSFDSDGNLILSNEIWVLSIDVDSESVNYAFDFAFFSTPTFSNFIAFGDILISENSVISPTTIPTNFSVSIQKPEHNEVFPLSGITISSTSLTSNNSTAGTITSGTSISEIGIVMNPLGENTLVDKSGLMLIDGPNIGEFSFYLNTDLNSRGSVITIADDTVEEQNHKIARVA